MPKIEHNNATYISVTGLQFVISLVAIIFTMATTAWGFHSAAMNQIRDDRIEAIKNHNQSILAHGKLFEIVNQWRENDTRELNKKIDSFEIKINNLQTAVDELKILVKANGTRR